MKLREKIVEISKQHVEECYYLEKHASGHKSTNFVGYIEEGSIKDATIPDIDDPKFQLLIENDKELDEKLKKSLKKVFNF